MKSMHVCMHARIYRELQRESCKFTLFLLNMAMGVFWNNLSCMSLVWSLGFTWRGRGLSKSFTSRVIIGVTPIRGGTYNSTYNLLTKPPAPSRQYYPYYKDSLKREWT